MTFEKAEAEKLINFKVVKALIFRLVIKVGHRNLQAKYYGHIQ